MSATAHAGHTQHVLASAAPTDNTSLWLQAAVAQGHLQAEALSNAADADLQQLLGSKLQGTLLASPVEVIAFSDEEGVR